MGLCGVPARCAARTLPRAARLAVGPISIARDLASNGRAAFRLQYLTGDFVVEVQKVFCLNAGPALASHAAGKAS